MKKVNRSFCTLVFILISQYIFSQELYVFTEPASNMPAHSVSFKLTARFPDSKYNNYFKQRYMPEVMFGLSKNWMLHLSGTFSDYFSQKIKWESVKGYLKYRFLSNDDVHEHFRMAAFLGGSYTRSPFLYDELTIEGDNSGLQGGFIATQLINKLAVSGTLSYLRVFANQSEHTNHLGHSLNMMDYSLSAGYLLLPRNYSDYRQANLNIYLELLGTKGIEKNHYALDLAPALQLIFNSTTKLNLGARFQLTSNMVRVGEKTYVVSMEHTILNVFRKKVGSQSF